jgi:hypothetical protein
MEGIMVHARASRFASLFMAKQIFTRAEQNCLSVESFTVHVMNFDLISPVKKMGR